LYGGKRKSQNFIGLDKTIWWTCKGPNTLARIITLLSI